MGISPSNFRIHSSKLLAKLHECWNETFANWNQAIVNMQSTRKLTRLPPELFEQVARFVAKDDLRSLRLVSRECCEKTLRPFAKAFFSNLKVVLNSEGSLRTAIKRVEHPFFGNFTQDVSVVIDEYKLGCGKCKILHDAQEWIQSQRLDLELLTWLFRKLRVLGRVQEVKLVTHSSAPRWNTQQKDHHDPKDCFAAPAMRDSRAFPVIMQALSTSGLNILTFTMDTPSWSLPLHRLSQQDILTFQDALQSITSLNLDIWIDNRTPSRTTAFIQTLSSLPHLAHLSLKHRDQSDIHFDVSDFPSQTHITENFLASTLSSLHFLHLTNMTIIPSQLSSFAQRHENLQKMRLTDPWFLGTREFNVRHHLPRQICEKLKGLVGKEDVEVEFVGGWDSWKWMTRTVVGEEPFGRW